MAAAVPRGARRADGPAHWLRAVELLVGREHWYESKRRAVMAWAREVASHVDLRSCTTRYTTAQALRATGKSSPTTMKSYRRWAEERGLMGEVAPGRKGVYAPARTNARTAADGTTTWVNDAAVRVLTMPLEVAEELEALTSCGQKMTPSLGTGSIKPPRARAKAARRGNEPLRGTESQRLTALWPGQTFRGDRWRPWWARRATKAWDEEVVAYARLLAEDVPTLRGTTDRWVASVIRPFVESGWTVRDLAEALEWLPNGRPWRISAQVRHPHHWLRFRLSQWLENGRPMQSLSQRRQAEREREQERYAAARAQAAAEQAQIASEPASGRLAGRLECWRALARAASDARRRGAALARVTELEIELAKTLAAEAQARAGLV